MKTTGHFPFVFLIAGNDAIAHKALLQTKVALSLRREDRRIAADLGWQLKAPVDHMVRSNSAFFSRRGCHFLHFTDEFHGMNLSSLVIRR